MVAIALRNSERLGRLIDDILDIERIESASVELRPRYLELAEVVRRSLEANQGFAASHGVRLDLVGHVPHAAVFADEDRLTQVLSNLISNAAKFSPRGETVDLSIVDAGDRVRVDVRDRGRGIPPEFTARIFQRFAQADNSDTREKGGTGLGLSIAKALVERMGGRIGFEPAETGGTRFFIELPARRIRLSSTDPQMRSGPACSSEPTLRAST
jgi:signal transduction histidine kinase